MRLLQSIANQSNGHFNMARSDRELHNVFASIFEQSKEPDILPMYGERFLVDSNVREITIVANKERLDTQISFTTPSGQQITEQNRPADIRWLVSDQFDLITMQNPQPGEWQMLPVGDKNRAYIITDLEMQLQLTPEKPQPGDVVSVDVWLEEDGQQLNRQEILAALRVSLVEQFPDGTVERFALLSSRTSDNYLSGYYHAKLHLNDYGRYRVEVSASTGTFDRVKSKIIDIQQVMAPDQLLAALEDPHSQAIQPIVAVEPPRAMPSVRPQEQVTPPKPAPQPEPETQEPEERPAKTPVPVEITEPEEEGGFLIGLLIFFLFNLILVGGGAAVWWLKRRVEAEPKS